MITGRNADYLSNGAALGAATLHQPAPTESGSRRHNAYRLECFLRGGAHLPFSRFARGPAEKAGEYQAGRSAGKFGNH